MENPIKENRIINDHTFAVRLLHHLEKEFNNVPGYHPMIEEEYEYFTRIACELIKYQFETCPDNEKWYFENLSKGCHSGSELIEKFFNEDFVKYLKVIKAI